MSVQQYLSSNILDSRFPTVREAAQLRAAKDARREARRARRTTRRAAR